MPPASKIWLRIFSRFQPCTDLIDTSFIKRPCHNRGILFSSSPSQSFNRDLKGSSLFLRARIAWETLSSEQGTLLSPALRLCHAPALPQGSSGALAPCVQSRVSVPHLAERSVAGLMGTCRTESGPRGHSHEQAVPSAASKRWGGKWTVSRWMSK